MSTPIKIVLYIILVPILLLALAAVLVPLFLDREKVLELASEAIYEQTGATLTVDGEVGISVFPTIGLSLEEVGLTMPQEEQSSLQLRALEIGVQLMPLFSGNVEIDTIAVDGLNTRMQAQEEPDAIDTSTLSDAELDAFYAKRRQEQAEAGAAAGSQAALAVPLALNVKSLTVSDSRLEMVDVTGTQTTEIELLSIEAKGLNLDGRPVPLALAIRIPGEQPIELAMEGEVRIDQDRQLLILDQVEVVVTGATAVPLELKTSGEVDINRQIAELELALELGETRGEGSLRYASFESPQIDTQLALNLLDPALLVLAGPEAAAEAGTEAAPSSGDDPLPLAAIRAIDTRARLTIDRAVFGAHTINGLKTQLRAVDGVIRLNTLTGDLHGGKLDLKATFNGKHNTATLNTAGGLAGLDLATALVALETEPVLTGKASLDWKLSSKGRTSNELVAAMTGPIKLATEEVVLQNIGVEKLLCQAVALVNQERLTATFPASTSFQTLGADIQLADGKAQLRPLKAELPRIALNGTGAFDLVSQDFKATFKARLSPELEELDPACRVSKRLTAIDWPVECKGNTSGEPAKWCGVDTGEIIEDLAKYEAQRKVKKEAGKLFDKFLKK